MNLLFSKTVLSHYQGHYSIVLISIAWLNIYVQARCHIEYFRYYISDFMVPLAPDIVKTIILLSHGFTIFFLFVFCMNCTITLQLIGYLFVYRCLRIKDNNNNNNNNNNKISSPNFIDTVHVDSPSLNFSSDWFIEFLCKFISKF